jgi:hypothetical protein
LGHATAALLVYYSAHGRAAIRQIQVGKRLCIFARTKDQKTGNFEDGKGTFIF